MRSGGGSMDVILLAIGAYVSGTSLIGGPLIIAVALRYIKPHEYRSTLLVIWFILVSIKLLAFSLANVDLQLFNALLLLPFAGIGHVIGLKLHQRLLQSNNRNFYATIGWVLLITSLMGIKQTIE
jgi:uncharacterized membrane protein YfcA